MFGILGVVLLLLGVADFISGFSGTDIWEVIPIEFPSQFADYSAYIMIGAGLVCIFLGRREK